MACFLVNLFIIVHSIMDLVAIRIELHCIFAFGATLLSVAGRHARIPREAQKN